MPSNRWPILTAFTCLAIAVLSTLWMNAVSSTEVEDTLGIASNGWRPIIGLITNQLSTPEPEVAEPRNQNTSKHIISLTSDDKKRKNLTSGSRNNGGNQVHINHHGSTGHHSKGHQAPIKSYKPINHFFGTGKPANRHPVMNKLQAHMAQPAKRQKHKQSRPSSNLRDEIMAPAPSSAIGTYAFYNQGPYNLQQGPSKFNNAPVDFSNHFIFSNNNNDLIIPQHTHYTVPKHPVQNDVQPSNNYVYYNQNDDFTRNLVPPPRLYKPQGEKETLLPQKHEQQQAISTSQLIVGKPQFKHYPEKPVLDLEITREKFKEFHTTLAPTSYKTSTESYLEQTKFTKPHISSHHGYEVTEGKDWNDHIFKNVYSTLNPGVQSYKNIFATSSGPDLNKFHYSQQQIIAPQHVETSPQFLPTPYNPLDTYPTSPTHADVSTVYSELSHLNQQKHQNFPEPDPTKFYNIKEVSTHYPIFENKRPVTQVTAPLPNRYKPTPTQVTYTSRPTQITLPIRQQHESVMGQYLTEVTSRRPSEPVEQYLNEVTTRRPIEHVEQYFNEVTTRRPQEPVEQYYNEVTTRREVETEPSVQYTNPTQQTTPSRKPNRRPGHRRRRPTRPSTTTENLEEQHELIYDVPQTEQPVSTERPRRRRPIRYRTSTTETPPETTPEPTTRLTTVRNKPTRPPQTITEENYTSRNHRYRNNHKNRYEPEEEKENVEPEFTTRQYSRFERPKEYSNHRTRYEIDQPEVEPTTEYSRFERPREDQHRKEVEELELNADQLVEVIPTTEFIRTYHDYKSDNVEQPPRIKNKRKRIRPHTTTTTTEQQPSTNLNIPENELDYTTTPVDQSEEATVQEIYEFSPEITTALLTTTSTTTTTTTEAPTTSTTTKSHRIRQRPMKYEVQRPRFSVKDYRQRLNQYMSSSTESTQSTTDTHRIRYPNRFKSSTSTPDDETTELRQKYKPNYPRHRSYTTESTTSSSSTSTEKYIRSMNSRIRPYNRFRSTTEPTTTTQRVSIKPNIFNNLKRPQHISLRNRIYNKRNSTTTTEINTESPEEFDSSTEETEVTIPWEPAESKIEITTQIYEPPVTTQKPIETSMNIEKVNDVMEDVDVADDDESGSDESEALLQLQRIQDLTSSAHKQYNTPGMFKSVSISTPSRRVPSYFTIATEDPILPIEAFFPNLNHKN